LFTLYAKVDFLRKAPHGTLLLHDARAPTEGSRLPWLGLSVPHRSFRPLMHAYYVYILASIQRTLYIGMSGELHRRIHQHKTGAIPGFTARYRVNRLVHFETFSDVRDARAREHQLKGWTRKKKIALIEAGNPEWDDLADRILPLSATEPVG
jgi:putative endonuclease